MELLVIILIYNWMAFCTSSMLSSQRPKNKRILVVDDEQDLLIITKRQLSKWYEVDTFESAVDAIDYIRQNKVKYDMIVSDIRMPKMNGFEFVREVRKIMPSIKVILITAFEINKSEFDIVHPSTQVDALLTKPFTASQLRALIQKELESKTAA
jgi:CheY-like chemotaxis protein